jgi:hypothetical protein
MAPKTVSSQVADIGKMLLTISPYSLLVISAIVMMIMLSLGVWAYLFFTIARKAKDAILDRLGEDENGYPRSLGYSKKDKSSDQEDKGYKELLGNRLMPSGLKGSIAREHYSNIPGWIIGKPLDDQPAAVIQQIANQHFNK